jgi:hypothetical protein
MPHLLIRSLFMLLLLWTFACPGAGAALAAPPLLLMDQGHGQRFLLDQEGNLHLSRFADILRTEGFAVKAATDRFSDESLAGVTALIIAGPFAAITEPEVDALVRFLDRGGRLAVMLHIGTPFSALLHRLDVDFTNYVLSEQENIIDGDPRNFRVKDFSPHPLFAGLNHFSLYGGWALMNTADTARIIASSSPRSWVDLDGDKKLSPGDVVQAFGVVVAGSRGEGRYVAFGDDAIFQNRFLDEQNQQLAHNLARWLK